VPLRELYTNCVRKKRINNLLTFFIKSECLRKERRFAFLRSADAWLTVRHFKAKWMSFRALSDPVVLKECVK